MSINNIIKIEKRIALNIAEPSLEYSGQLSIERKVVIQATIRIIT